MYEKHRRIGIILLLNLALIMSCSPTIHYLGDSYPARGEVDVYYDENDVRKDFKVIGQMTNDKMLHYELDSIKEKMIKKAKEKGADGIVFVNFWIENDPDGILDKNSVSAKLIKYID